MLPWAGSWVDRYLPTYSGSQVNQVLKGFEESRDLYVRGPVRHVDGRVQLGVIVQRPQGPVCLCPLIELVAMKRRSRDGNKIRMVAKARWRGGCGSAPRSILHGKQILVFGEIGGEGQIAGMSQCKGSYVGIGRRKKSDRIGVSGPAGKAVPVAGRSRDGVVAVERIGAGLLDDLPRPSGSRIDRNVVGKGSEYGDENMSALDVQMKPYAII